jgi:hypothetical protein
MPCSRRFPPPWTVEDVGGSFVVKASDDRPLIFIYYREGVGRRSLTRLLTPMSHAGSRQASLICRSCCARVDRGRDTRPRHCCFGDIRRGRSPDLIKNENPAAPAVKLEADEDWRR